MAIFHFQLNSLSRRGGRSATAAAAYRAGEQIRDERTGALHNHAARQDVRHKEIVLPAAVATTATWATQRGALWNAAEHAESRRDARTAREYVVALPAELNHEQRIGLAQAFARHIAERHRVAVDLAVHDPRSAGDARNFHAHLLATTREVHANGLGAKSVMELNGDERHRRGLSSGRAEIVALRARWAQLTNEALAEAGLSARVDHRSLAAQGINREPQPRIPYVAIQMERRGIRSEVADRIRAQYAARIAARGQSARASELQAASAQGAGAQATAVAEREAGASTAHARLEAVRAQARQAWLQMREQTKSPAAEQPEARRVIDKDLAL